MVKVARGTGYMRKGKHIVLYGYSEGGYRLNIVMSVIPSGGFQAKGSFIYAYPYRERTKRSKKQEQIRRADRVWVYRNIPSSIWWHTEIHHDWTNNGTMYLLTKGEHILRHRREKG